MQKSGRSPINGNVSKCKFWSDHSLTGKYVFRNGYLFTRIYLHTKLGAVTYKQELRTYAYDRRHSNSLRGNRSPRWPTVQYPDTSSDSFFGIVLYLDNSIPSFFGMSLSTWLVHNLVHKCTSMYLATFALRTMLAFSGLALRTTIMAYWYLRTYLSTVPLRTKLAYSTYPTLWYRLLLHSSGADISLSYWQTVPSSYPLHSDRPC